MREATRLGMAAMCVLGLGAALRLAPIAGIANLSAVLTGGCLVVAALGARAVARRSIAYSPEQRSWMALSASSALFACGQVVVIYFLVTRGGKIVFPSAADAFFVVATLLAAWALYTFARTAQRCGLPLGGPIAFWAPAGAVGIVALAAAYPGIGRALRTTGTPLEQGVKLFYPMIDFVILAACAVLVRVALQFHGGRLLRTWLPIALGWAVICSSAVLFSQLSSTHGEMAIAGSIDTLYFLGTVGVCFGVMNQVLVLRDAAPALARLAPRRRSLSSASK
jgi:hypothetical protein